MKVLVIGFGTLALVIATCILLARRFWREVALEDADAALRSEYEGLVGSGEARAPEGRSALARESDRGKK